MIFIERKWKERDIIYYFHFLITFQKEFTRDKKKSGGKIQLISINRKQKNIAECFGI